jgi:hypothetical protein
VRLLLPAAVALFVTAPFWVVGVWLIGDALFSTVPAFDGTGGVSMAFGVMTLFVAGFGTWGIVEATMHPGRPSE